MGINMNLENSRRQAESIEKEMKKRIEGYEGLIRAITKIGYTTGELKGQAYDAMREYFEEILMPIAKGGKLLSELTTKVAKELPERYVREVHSSSLNEEELELIIAEYRAQERRLERLLSNDIVLLPNEFGQGEYEYKNHLLVSSNVYRDMRRYYEELLQKLRIFNRSTENITREIEELSKAIKSGLMAIKNTSCYNQMSGEFDIKELKGEEWLKKLNILNELNEARKIETREEKEYKEVLMKDFGFEERTANIILKLKRAIDKKFAHYSKEIRFYIFNRIIGDRHYNDILWKGTAGSLGDYFYKEVEATDNFGISQNIRTPYSLEEIYKELGLSKKEYTQLMYELNIQHRFAGVKAYEGNYMRDKRPEKFKKEFAEYKRVYGEHLTEDDFIKKWNRDRRDDAYHGKGDFTHQSITMATNLYKNHSRLANIAGSMYNSTEPHKVTNDLAGWLGDTTNKAFKEPSMKGDDYKADLDAVNILYMYNEDKSRDPIEVVNGYYRKIRKGELNRATRFKENLGLKYIEDGIRKVYELRKVTEYGNGYILEERTLTMEELKIKNPVGYNFIMNLINGNNKYIKYVKQEKENEE
ncbi:hypothetical protein [Parvimonas sp. C2]|uniref:hypothetical protein n=2 Tax=Parvimonas TaxID=543311 RepID=UPI002B4846C4|nr:hypothetical protein [Parvimonas sp. C2]MEB3073643.1 hypothetical protein [Parvimonas sp. C2]